MTDIFCLLLENKIKDLSPQMILLISILAIIISIAIIIFLVFRIFKERKRVHLERNQRDRMGKAEFKVLLEHRCKNAGKNTHFSIFKICINNAKGLMETFGKEFYTASQDILTDRIKYIFKSDTKLCGENEDTIYVLSDTVYENEELKEYAKYMAYEVGKVVELSAGVQMHFDFSIGVTTFNEASKTVDIILQNADMALLNAKKNGLNTYSIYNYRWNSTSNEELKVYNEVQQAIKENEFCFYLQPMCTTSKTVFGYEMLLRWQHKELGLLSPSQFLNVLEESGNINWVGRIGIEYISLHYKQINQEGKNHSLITFNLSKNQLLNSNLFQETISIIKKNNIPCSNIGFEISDFSLIEISEVVRNNINSFSNAGFQIILDNFNLQMDFPQLLEKIKVNIIKLKKDLIINSIGNSLNVGLIKVLKQYAAENNIKILALGIETEEELKAIEDAGIHFVQGYLLGKPQDINNL